MHVQYNRYSTHFSESLASPLTSSSTPIPIYIHKKVYLFSVIKGGTVDFGYDDSEGRDTLLLDTCLVEDSNLVSGDLW